MENFTVVFKIVWYMCIERYIKRDSMWTLYGITAVRALNIQQQQYPTTTSAAAEK